jgi:hypothetical protein
MRLSILIAGVVALVGCRKETEIQKCDRLRLEAKKRLTAYLDARAPEAQRLETEADDLRDRDKALDEIGDSLDTAADALKCGYIVGVSGRAQIERDALVEIYERGKPALAAAAQLTDGGIVPVPLPEAMKTEVETARRELALALEGWKAAIDDTPSRPGKPWSPEQRSYLTSLEQAWCRVEAVLTPVAEDQEAILTERAASLSGQLDFARTTLEAHRARSAPAQEILGVLAKDPQPITIAPVLRDDLDFAPVETALKSYSLCRN